MTGQTLGPYRITAKLGEGGMGIVYRGHDPRLKRDVAIKVLPAEFARDPERVARFQREATTLAALTHPNIAVLYGVEESAGALALVMEMVEGPTLAEVLAQGALEVDEALRIARQIAEALDGAHEKNITHRDLKPANVKVTPDGTVKLLDFGLAKAMANTAGFGDRPTENSPTLTLPLSQVGMVMGTAGYMSPEQVRGAEADRRSDIWSFGVVLYEMLTGQRLFAGESIPDTLAAVLKGPIDWSVLPAETQQWVRRLLERTLERDRRKRLRDIGDAFAEESAAVAVAAVAITAPVVGPVVRRRGWWVVAVVGVAAALLGAAVSWLSLPRVPETPVRRFSFAPEGLGAHEYLRDVVISPNGKSIAYVAAGKLWIRDLAGEEARAIEGSEGALGPFWSPDSGQVGFAVGQELKKARIAGGFPLKVWSFSGVYRGGAWSPDGRGMAVSAGGEVFEVSPESGSARKVVGDGSNLYLYPQFVGESRRPVLMVGRGGRFQQRIVAVDWASMKEEEIREGFYAVWVPGGRVVFQGEGLRPDLWIAPWRVGESKFSGEAVSIISGGNSLSVSNDGTGVWADSPLQEQVLTWRDREGGRLGTVGTARVNVRQVELSRDGGRVLFNDNDVFVEDVVRGVRTRVTSDGFSFAGRWRPGSNEFVFTSNRSGGGDIYLQTADLAREPKLILSSSVQDAPEDWSPDGTTLVFRRGTSANLDLLMMRREADGKYSEPAAYLASAAVEMQAQISEDGRWVAYVSNESGRYEVYVQSFPVPGSKVQISTRGGRHPRWRRDGSEIFYVEGDALMSVPVRVGATVEPGVAKELFRNAGLESVTGFITYDVAADGQRFLIAEPVASTGKTRSIHVVENFPAWVRAKTGVQ